MTTKKLLTKKINTVYVQANNYAHAKKARDIYGSTSAYINHLINKDRGSHVQEFGHWKPKTK